MLQLKNGADPNASYFMGFEINFISVLKVEPLRLLLKYGANPNTRDRAGLTPLMKAARHPQGYAAVELLVEHGADANDIAGERHDFRTVLHHHLLRHPRRRPLSHHRHSDCQHPVPGQAAEVAPGYAVIKNRRVLTSAHCTDYTGRGRGLL